MVFATERVIQLQRRLDDDLRDGDVISWCLTCGEDDCAATATCEDETAEASFAKKPLFAEGHPRDGGEICWE
jgi:hypothetical protein